MEINTKFEFNSAIDTGFDALDSRLIRFEPGTLIAIGGCSEVGKTGFVLSLISNISCKKNVPTGLVSLENKATTILKRLLSVYSGISLYKIQHEMMPIEEWKLYTSKLIELQDYPFVIDDTQYNNFADLKGGIESMTQKGSQVIFLDSYQWIDLDDCKRQNRDKYAEQLCKSLKRLAHDLNIAIVLVVTLPNSFDPTHFSSSFYSSNSKEIGDIIEFCDMAIVLHRFDQFYVFEDIKGNDLRGIADIIVEKNKNGDTIFDKLFFNKDCISFETLSENSQSNYLASKIDVVDACIELPQNPSDDNQIANESIQDSEEAKNTEALKPLHFFNEKIFCTDGRKMELKDALQSVIDKDVEKRQDWYAVLRGAQSVKEGIDKLGKKHKVLAEKASDVAMFEDLCMLFPELKDNTTIFPINETENEAKPSDKYKTLRKSVSEERKHWKIKGKGELLVTEWEKTEYIPSTTESNTGKRIDNKEEKYRRMLRIGKKVKEALEQLLNSYIQS